MNEVMQAPAAVSVTDNALVQSTTDEQRDHNVRSFLQRAYSIANFTWSKTAATGDILATYRFPDILLSQPALAAKTRNFFGLRAGVELLVLVNKQQFQAGNLLISYLPNARYNPAKVAMAQTSLQTRTGMPRTNLDLMDATRATLQVPYASPFVYYNLLTGDGTIGDFYISVYSPLSDVAAAGTVSVQVFARFVDVDIKFPTGSAPASFSQTRSIDNFIEEFRVKPNFNSLKQLIKEGSSILKSVKDNEFRFQMNSENNATMNMKLRALPNMAVSSDSNNAHIMSLSSSNVLPSTNMGETSSSEMNISTVLQIPVYHDRFNISNEASGVNVWSKLVQPQVPITPNADGSLDVDYIHFHAEPFSKWRGSLVYHFRVVKTTFHSLRVRVWFSPASLISDTIDRNAVYSKIVDLKDTNRFTFEVPFVWPHPFLNVHVNPMSLGTIGVDIINQMVFPATVDSTIVVIVERSAGTDFCLNLPTVVRSFPFDPTAPTRRVQRPVQQRLPDVVPIPAPVAQRSSTAQHTNTNFAVVRDVPLTQQNLDKLTNLPSSIRDALHRQLQAYPGRELLSHATALDLLASREDLTTGAMSWSTQNLSDRFNSFNTSDHQYGATISLRTSPQGLEVLRLKRSVEDDYIPDLTQYGVESNPGPTESFAFRVDSLVANTATSTLTGPVAITVTFCSNTTAISLFELTGAITGTFRTEINNSIFFNFYSLTDFPEITFTPTFMGGGVSFNVIFSNDFVTVTGVPVPVPLDVNVVSPNPVDVNILTTVTLPVDVQSVLPNPLPVDVVSGVSSDVNLISVDDSVVINSNIVSPNPLPVTVDGILPTPLPVYIQSSEPLPIAGVVSVSGTVNANTTIVAPLPVPVSGGGGGGGSSIVATTSITPSNGDFFFQMNMEQDSLRTGFDDETFHRPVQSLRADQLSLGQNITDIREMVKRSSLLGETIDPLVANQFITIIPHQIGIVKIGEDDLPVQNACDLLSYYASTYAFARGGINLRIVCAPDFYFNVVLDSDSTFFPGSGIGAVAQNTTPITAVQQFQLNNPLQQVIKPSLEGFGEISVPFYSDTFMYSINPVAVSTPSMENQTLQLPYSQLALVPNGVYTHFRVFRAACSDFEFSYLTGPPKLFPITS